VERLWADPPKYELRVVLRDGERHHFGIRGTKFGCTLAFFGLESGSMISCTLDPLDSTGQLRTAVQKSSTVAAG